MNLAYAELYISCLASVFSKFSSKEVRDETDIGILELVGTTIEDAKLSETTPYQLRSLALWVLGLLSLHVSLVHRSPIFEILLKYSSFFRLSFHICAHPGMVSATPSQGPLTYHHAGQLSKSIFVIQSSSSPTSWSLLLRIGNSKNVSGAGQSSPSKSISPQILGSNFSFETPVLTAWL